MDNFLVAFGRGLMSEGKANFGQRGLRWLRLSEQNPRLDKWSVCRC